MITPELKLKLSKIYELIKGGATEGERAAAEKALERMIAKHKLNGIDLESLDRVWCELTYTTEMEFSLIFRLVRTLMEHLPYCRTVTGGKRVQLSVTYVDKVTISSAYEYFRRHMKAQWKVYCAPNLKRCRTVKSRNARRKELQDKFFSQYAIASNLYRPEEIETVDLSKVSKKEYGDFVKMEQVQGGKYNVQVTNGLLLEN